MLFPLLLLGKLPPFLKTQVLFIHQVLAPSLSVLRDTFTEISSWVSSWDNMLEAPWDQGLWLSLFSFLPSTVPATQEVLYKYLLHLLGDGEFSLLLWGTQSLSSAGTGLRWFLRTKGVTLFPALLRDTASAAWRSFLVGVFTPQNLSNSTK